MEKIEENVIKIGEKVDRLDRHVFGGPGVDPLEDRLRSYVEARDAHRRNSTAEIVDNLNAIVDKDRQTMEINHKDNSKKLDRLTWIVAVGVGVLGTLQFLLVVFAGKIIGTIHQ